MPTSQWILILVLVLVAAGITIFVAKVVGALAFLALGALLLTMWLRRPK